MWHWHLRLVTLPKDSLFTSRFSGPDDFGQSDAPLSRPPHDSVTRGYSAMSFCCRPLCRVAWWHFKKPMTPELNCSYWKCTLEINKYSSLNVIFIFVCNLLDPLVVFHTYNSVTYLNSTETWLYKFTQTRVGVWCTIIKMILSLWPEDLRFIENLHFFKNVRKNSKASYNLYCIENSHRECKYMGAWEALARNLSSQANLK